MLALRTAVVDKPAAPLIAWVPIAALAGILIVIGVRMFDRHSLQLLKSRSTILDSVVIVAVVVRIMLPLNNGKQSHHLANSTDCSRSSSSKASGAPWRPGCVLPTPSCAPLRNPEEFAG